MTSYVNISLSFCYTGSFCNFLAKYEYFKADIPSLLFKYSHDTQNSKVWRHLVPNEYGNPPFLYHLWNRYDLSNIVCQFSLKNVCLVLFLRNDKQKSISDHVISDVASISNWLKAFILSYFLLILIFVSGADTSFPPVILWLLKPLYFILRYLPIKFHVGLYLLYQFTLAIFTFF